MRGGGVDFGNPEVQHLDRLHVLLDLIEDIVWLQIAVSDAFAVHVLQHVAHLLGKMDRFRKRNPPTSEDSFPERFTFQEFHHDVANPIFNAGINHLDGVGVRDFGRGLGFALKPGNGFGVFIHIADQELDGYHLVQTFVMSLIDFAHPARAEQFDNSVSFLEIIAN